MSMVDCLIKVRQKFIDGKIPNEKLSYVYMRMNEFIKEGTNRKESFIKAQDEWNMLQIKYFNKGKK